MQNMLSNCVQNLRHLLIYDFTFNLLFGNLTWHLDTLFTVFKSAIFLSLKIIIIMSAPTELQLDICAGVQSQALMENREKQNVTKNKTQ